MLLPFLSCLLWFNSRVHIDGPRNHNNLRNGHMFKRTVTMMLAAGTLVLGGCASNGGAEQAADNSDFDGPRNHNNLGIDPCSKEQ